MVGAGSYVNLSDYKISKIGLKGKYSGRKCHASGHQGVMAQIDAQQQGIACQRGPPARRSLRTRSPVIGSVPGLRLQPPDCFKRPQGHGGRAICRFRVIAHQYLPVAVHLLRLPALELAAQVRRDDQRFPLPLAAITPQRRMLRQQVQVIAPGQNRRGFTQRNQPLVGVKTESASASAASTLIVR